MRRLALFALALTACSSGPIMSQWWACDPGSNAGCQAGTFCEYVGNLGSACYPPITIAGRVWDPVGLTSVAGARVVALDVNRAPVSTVAVTGTDGRYSVGVRAARDGNGNPVSQSVILRADAQGYETFPGGIRPALPIDLSRAGSGSTVSGPLTEIALFPRSSGSAWIAGTVARTLPGIAPPLVVAEPESVATAAVGTGVADQNGSYAVYNLSEGVPYVVSAYARGANHPRVTTAALAPGPSTVNVSAPAATPPTAGFTGNLIFNNGATPPMQVSLVLESTYVTTLDRGASPPGLTVDVPAGAGTYAVSGVPDGRWVVLAAFGHDDKVRDVSGGGNTAAPRVTMAAGALVETPPGFKIRPSVELLSIGGATVGADPVVTVSTATPEFRWAPGSGRGYSSASTFRILVLDAFGGLAWTRDVDAVAPVTYGTGGSTAVPLAPGQFYQLRILAIAEASPVPDPFTQLSQTEDVLGVFTFAP
jgi:hypothetical protein